MSDTPMTDESRPGHFTDRIREAMRAHFDTLENDASSTPSTDASSGDGVEPEGQGESAPSDAPVAEIVPDASVPAEDARDEGEGEVGGGEPADASQPAVASTTAASGFADLNDYARRVYGRELNADEAAALFQGARLMSEMASLSEPQRLAIQQVMQGGVEGVQAGAEEGRSQPVLDPDDPDAELYQRFIAPLESRLNEITQAQEAERVRAQQEEQRIIADQATAAINTWREAHPDLTDAEVEQLALRGGQTGMFPALLAHHNKDVSAATHQLLDQLYWNDPDFREREFARQHAAQTTANAPQQARAQKAASVAGGGGSAVPRDDLTPQSPADRRAAFAAGIARAMNDQ